MSLSLQRIETLYPELRKPALQVLERVQAETGLAMKVTPDPVRSMEDQWALYKKGRVLQHGIWVISERSQIVTNAKPGSSWHCFGLALDLAWEGDDPYLEKRKKEEQDRLWNSFGAIGESLGFKWGGKFKIASGSTDRPHLEMTFGMNLSEAMSAFQVQGLPSVWKKVDQKREITNG